VAWRLGDVVKLFSGRSRPSEPIRRRPPPQHVHARGCCFFVPLSCPSTKGPTHEKRSRHRPPPLPSPSPTAAATSDQQQREQPQQQLGGAPSGPGRVFLVGTGPGDPGLLTVRALQLMQSADVVLYDRLVSDDILRLVHGGARMVYVGKQVRMGGPGRTAAAWPQGGLHAAALGACILRKACMLHVPGRMRHASSPSRQPRLNSFSSTHRHSISPCNPDATPHAQAGYHTRSQGEIHELLLQFAEAGATVVRLKGGDPYVFGRCAGGLGGGPALVQVGGPRGA